MDLIYYLDDFCITVGDSVYSGNFIPSEKTYSAGTGGTPVNVNQYTGNQNSALRVEASSVMDISKGDFTIEVAFRPDSIFQMFGGEPDLRYNIIGQYEDEMVADGDSLTKNWWALEYITDASGNTEFRFRVYDASSNSYVVDIYYPVTLDWASSFTNYEKANLDPSYIHVAVVRNGYEIRLFVNGDYVGTSESAVHNWDTITSDFQVNGQQAYYTEDFPYTVTYIKALRVLDYALYWDEFTPNEDFMYPGGICVYPRVFPILFLGRPGDTIADLSIKPRFDASVYYAGDDGSDNYPHRIDVIAPEFQISITGLVEIIGQTSDGPLTKKLEFAASGYEGFLGTLDIEVPRESYLGLNWSGIINEIGSFDLTLPHRDAPSVGFEGFGLLNPTATIDIILPKEISFEGFISETGSLSVRIPIFTLNPASHVGVVGRLAIDIPAQKIYITSHSSASGTMGITIPMLQTIFEFSPTAYVNLVMNIRNYGLTEYANYNFNSMCRFNNKHFGANGTAVYDLDSGKTDDGTFIDWNFRSGFIDLEQKVKKKLKQAWISYKSDGDLLVTVVLPDGTEYEYELDEIYADETGLRVKFGKGISSKYVAVDVKNVDGADIVMDSMKIMMDKVGAER